MIKKIVILIIVISNIFMLSGCWSSVEIDKMEFVAGVAIDKGTNGKKYNITAELVQLKGNEKGSVSSQIVESSGNTIFDAIRNMISITSQKLYWGHSKAIIISEELAREGIIPILDLFLRDNDSRLSIDVIISKNSTAKDILSIKSELPSIISYDIYSMLNNNLQSLSKSTKSEVYKTINAISSKGISATLPVISIEKVNDKDIYKLDGIAVFKKDKLVGFLNSEESKYFLFIVNKIKVPILPIQINNNENSRVTAEIFQNKTSIKHNVENNDLSINIQINTIVGVDDVETYTNYLGITNYQNLEEKMEKQLENSIQKLILKVQKDFNSDIFGFGQIIYQQNPKLWKKYELNWDDIFQNLKPNVNSKFTIRDSGTTKNTIKNGA